MLAWQAVWSLGPRQSQIKQCSLYNIVYTIYPAAVLRLLCSNPTNSTSKSKTFMPRTHTPEAPAATHASMDITLPSDVTRQLKAFQVGCRRMQ